MAKATTAPKKKGSQKPSAQLIEGDNATDLPVEEMPAAQLITPEEKAKQEISRFNIARAWIADKKEQYGGLTIASVEDKDGQKAVLAAWQEIRNKRLEVQKKHTEIKADYLKITRVIDGEKNDLVNLLEEIENPLKAELDRIEAIKEEEKKKAEREKAEKLQGRVNELISTGMAFNGSYYAIGATISMDVVTLQNMNDADYSTFLGRVRQENITIVAAKETKEKQEREEREALEAQKKQQEETQRQQEEKQRQLKAQQEALDRQKQEAIDARTKARGYHLEALGMFYNYGTHVWEFKTIDCGNTIIHRAKVETQEGQDWETELNNVTEEVKKLKTAQAAKDEEKAQAEKKRLEQQEKERKEAEEQRQRIATRKTEISALYGMTMQSDGTFKRHYAYKEIAPLLITKSQLENYNPEAWAAELENLKDCHAAGLKLQADAKTLEDAAAETARVAALSDRDRVNEYLRNFAEATGKRPQITDKRIKKAWDAFDKVVAGAVEDLSLILDNIK
jgi:hypothetical protein